MKAAFLIVNSACNNHCLYCFYNSAICLRETANFDIVNIPHLISFLNKNSITELMITGGDCLHDSYFSNTVKIISEVSKKSDAEVHILSSSTNLSVERASTLKKAGLTSVYISIDSIDYSINDFLRGNTKKTLQAITLYRDQGIDIRASVVVSSKSYKTLNETYDFLINSGFSEINIQPCHLSDNFNDRFNLKIEAIPESDLVTLFSQIKNFLINQNKSRYAELLNNMYIYKKSIKSIDCYMGRDKCVIKNDGSVVRCFHDLTELGTIFDDSPIGVLEKPCATIGKHCVSLFSEKYYNQEDVK